MTTLTLTVARGPAVLDELPSVARTAADHRLRLAVTALTGEDCRAEGRELARAVAEAVGDDASRLWLVCSVLGADLPTEDEMSAAVVRLRLADVWAALAPVIDRLAGETSFGDVEVVVGGITCDVSITSRTARLSGIQRVVREVSRRWRVDHAEAVFLAWTEGYTGLCLLSDQEAAWLFGEPGAVATEHDEVPRDPTTVVVPWRGIHLVPELYTQAHRVDRMLALTKYSGLHVADVGYDCIPVTSAATPGPGMVAAFTRALASRRSIDRIAAISDAAAQEYRGWVGMCAGRGGRRPEVTAITLPTEAEQPSQEELAEARELMELGVAPLVLVVGSHEPRKNHLAVLHASESLWQEGLDFTLTLVGAAAWRSEAYEIELERLQGLGRPIHSLRALSDHLLWAAYRLAHCTVFPSLNEGFGLPVAESLAAGTPVITSDFGSMRDIVVVDGRPLGGMLVDPRDDASVIEALRTMLTDDAVHSRLKQETARRPVRTWDDYAAELWDYLVDGITPTTT